MNQATCERCGNTLPDDARYCPRCGFPVGAPLPEERKVVTIIFVDLVGSSKLSTLIDPERYREVISAYYQAVAEELESLRGRAENFAGDAVLGAFGVPAARDDDALRAVRAGLSIVERTGRLGESLALPVPLLVRGGIQTGPVAIGAEPTERGLLFGAVVNLAARLQEAASPGEVLVGETTWFLTRHDVDYGPRREVEAKGFEMAAAWPVVALGPRSSRRTIPFVDRKRELLLMNETFARVRETGRGHLVTLFGEPGVGKTRLAEEFLAGLPAGTAVLSGGSDPFDEDVTFAPLAQMLLGVFGEAGDAPPDVLRSRLETQARAVVPEEQARSVAQRLGSVLGISAGDGGEARYRGGEIRSALLTFLAGLTSSGAAVLVLEDAHLARPSFLDLLEQLVREAKEVPVLVLVVGRWELLDDRPDWGGGFGDSLTLYLEPMSMRDSTELAIEAGDNLDELTAERIARHSGGNPFFIVETTGMLKQEEGQLPGDTGPLPRALLPPTVQAVISSRIDRLSDDARDLLRKASVFPRATFDISELVLIADPAESALMELDDEELLVREEARPTVWRFRHGLVRDVAYESLPKRERQRLHLRLANRFSRPDVADRYPRSTAYHLEQAAKAALDLNPKDRTLAERAVDALARAGDAARRGIESRTAEDLYERALALAGPERIWGIREAWVLSRLGEARYWLGEFEPSARALARALELGGEEIPAVSAHASRFLGDIVLTIRGEPDAAAGLFEQALGAARALGDPTVLARTLLMAGWVPFWRHDLGGARAMFEEALDVARANPKGDRWAEARALVAIAEVTSPVGDETICLDLALRSLSIGEEMGDAFTAAVGQETATGSLRRMGRLAEALDRANASLRVFRELDARWEIASVLAERGAVYRSLGKLDLAEEDLRWSYRLSREIKERALVSWTVGELARTLAARGDPSGARQVLREPAASVPPKEPGSLTSILNAEAVVALAEGDTEGALATSLRSLDVDRRQGWDNVIAAQVWWVGCVFGPDIVGGEAALAEARRTLESHHWKQALHEPDTVAT